MKRALLRIFLSIVAVVIANVSAPLLFALALEIVRAFFYPDAISPEGTIQTLALFGFFGIALIFDTVFPISLMLALIGLAARWYSPRIYVGGGAAIGLGFYLYRFSSLPSGDQGYLLTSIPIGAICGWIYWRIALRKPKAEPEKAENP